MRMTKYLVLYLFALTLIFDPVLFCFRANNFSFEIANIFEVLEKYNSI